MFIDKIAILESAMIKRKVVGRKKDILGKYYILPIIFRYQFEHYTLRLTLSTYNCVVNYIKDNNLYKNSDELPDSNSNGDVYLYYNIDEAISILKNTVELKNKELSTKKSGKVLLCQH